MHFLESINRARLAITGQPVHSLTTATTQPAVTVPALTVRPKPGAAPKPRVAPPPAAPFPAADELRAGVTLSSGATRVHDALVDLARAAHQAQGRAATPCAQVYHCPAVIVAALTGYSERHLYRLAAELNTAGLIHSRAHVGQVGHLRRYTGTLWAVALKPGARARLRFWDFQAPWRADFDADYYGESGAWREVQQVMSEPLTLKGKTARLSNLAKAWVAGTRTAKTPLRDGSDMRLGAGLPGVALTIPGLIHLHPKRRHQAVSACAAEIAHALKEPHRLKQWCGAIYRALNAENELRPGLDFLVHQLTRFAAELRAGEGEGMKRPGAVLTARLT